MKILLVNLNGIRGWIEAKIFISFFRLFLRIFWQSLQLVNHRHLFKPNNLYTLITKLVFVNFFKRCILRRQKHKQQSSHILGIFSAQDKTSQTTKKCQQRLMSTIYGRGIDGQRHRKDFKDQTIFAIIKRKIPTLYTDSSTCDDNCISSAAKDPVKLCSRR